MRIGAAELIAEGDVDLLRQAWLTATRARNALVLVRGKPTDQLPGPGRQLNAVARCRGLGHRRRRRVPRQLSAGDPSGKGGGTKGVSDREHGFRIRRRSVRPSTTGCSALYGPLTEALRKLIDAGIRTEADEEHRSRARRPRSRRLPDARSCNSARVDDDAAPCREPVARWHGRIPLSGLRNAIAPPMVIHHEDRRPVLE